MTLREALLTVLDEGLEDHVYQVRDRAREDDRASTGGRWEHPSWEHPRVRRYIEAVAVIRREAGKPR